MSKKHGGARGGSGRPGLGGKRGDTVRFSLSADAAITAKLDRWADRLGCSRGELVRRAMRALSWADAKAAG